MTLSFSPLIALTLLVPLAAADDVAAPQVSIDTAIHRGVDFLVRTQNPNGSWGNPTHTKGLNIYAPLPGAHHAYRAGASGLALSGLLDTKDPREDVAKAITRGSEWMTENLPILRRADMTTTYNVWGHAYGLRALTRLHQQETDPAKKAKWAKLAQEQVDLLGRYDDVNGGWGYLDIFDQVRTQRPTGIPTSFTTATVLLAMAEARDEMGLKLNDSVVKMALRGIQMQRTPDFSYTYSFLHRWRPRSDINRPAGSLGRTQACNACLRVFGDPTITDEVLSTCADHFLDRQGFLSNGRKRPVPHEAPFKIAGYFYYYGVFYFTRSCALLPKKTQLDHAKRIAAILIPLQEKDGSWWDYPLYDYHQAYGTGYALMTLAWCRDVINAAATDSKTTHD
jgi:hypothetical protein